MQASNCPTSSVFLRNPAAGWPIFPYLDDDLIANPQFSPTSPKQNSCIKEAFLSPIEIHPRNPASTLAEMTNLAPAEKHGEASSNVLLEGKHEPSIPRSYAEGLHIR